MGGHWYAQLGGWLPNQSRNGMFESVPAARPRRSPGRGGSPLRPGLKDFGQRGDPLVIAVGRELQRLRVRDDSKIEQLSLRIKPAQRKVSNGQRSMETEPRGFEVGGTRLGGGDVGFHIVANASPEIDLIGRIQG